MLLVLGMFLSASFFQRVPQNSEGNLSMDGDVNYVPQAGHLQLEMSPNHCGWLKMSVNPKDYPAQASKFGKMRDSVHLVPLLN